MALYKDFPNLLHTILNPTIWWFLLVRSHPNNPNRVQAGIIYVQQIVELLNLDEWIDEDTEPEEPAD